MNTGKALARDAARRALALDPRLGLAHGYLASIHVMEGDLAAAAREYERAMAVSPKEPRVQANAARLLTRLGRLEDTARVARWYVRQDPSSAQTHLALCVAEISLRRFKAAETACRTTKLLAPDLIYVSGMLAEAQLLGGRPAEALKTVEGEQDVGVLLAVQAKAHRALGREAEAASALRAFETGPAAAEWPTGAAEIHAVFGDADQAFAWLDRAAAEGDQEASHAHNNLYLTALHKDARWLPFLRKVGSAPEQLAKIAFNPKLPD
jgi:tetratricopeptide (TPR) repeat protein